MSFMPDDGVILLLFRFPPQPDWEKSVIYNYFPIKIMYEVALPQRLEGEAHATGRREAVVLCLLPAQFSLRWILCVPHLMPNFGQLAAVSADALPFWKTVTLVVLYAHRLFRVCAMTSCHFSILIFWGSSRGKTRCILSSMCGKCACAICTGKFSH